MEKPLVDNSYLLEKFPGKGGWTYAEIPGIEKKKKVNWGWLKVKGTIDGYQINQYHLAPMKGGGLFLPVKASIRKKIGKEAGDYVHIILYPDEAELEIPTAFELCLIEEPAAHRFFKSLSPGEQRLYIVWISAAKRENTQVERIAHAINKLLKKQKLYEKKF